jgi:hypothetical protein
MNYESEPGSELPAELMPGVAWSFFGGELFEEQGVFEAAVTAYHEEVGASGRWRPTELAVSVPRIRVKYFGVDPDEPDEYADYETELSSAGENPFSNSELLFKLHNAVAASLREADHCYFEGLELIEPGGGGSPPLYEMRQGS